MCPTSKSSRGEGGGLLPPLHFYSWTAPPHYCALSLIKLIVALLKFFAPPHPPTLKVASLPLSKVKFDHLSFPFPPLLGGSTIATRVAKYLWSSILST